MDLPSGWVPLAHFDSRERGKSDGHSADYKLLVSAVRDGELRGLQDPKSRRYYVPQDAANRLLIGKATQAADKPADESKQARATASSSQIEAAVIALCEINNGITLMQATLERLTTAVENIATQPKAEPVGTWRDMNGEVMN
jgi:hypothetical protein